MQKHENNIQKVCTFQNKFVYLYNEKGKRVTAATLDTSPVPAVLENKKQLKKWEQKKLKR